MHLVLQYFHASATLASVFMKANVQRLHNGSTATLQTPPPPPPRQSARYDCCRPTFPSPLPGFYASFCGLFLLPQPTPRRALFFRALASPHGYNRPPLRKPYQKAHSPSRERRLFRSLVAINYLRCGSKRNARGRCLRKSTSSKSRVWKNQQAAEPPRGPPFSSRTPYSGSYNRQELSTGIVDDAKLQRREEEPGAGQTNSRENSRL